MASEWISVKDRMPENNDSVLCYCENITIQGGTTHTVGSCDCGFWFLQNGVGVQSYPNREWEVTHWMALPEPPEVNTK